MKILAGGAGGDGGAEEGKEGSENLDDPAQFLTAISFLPSNFESRSPNFTFSTFTFHSCNNFT